MNIRSMIEDDVDLVVAYLFRKNNQPESSSNFCCKSEEAIRKDTCFCVNKKIAVVCFVKSIINSLDLLVVSS